MFNTKLSIMLCETLETYYFSVSSLPYATFYFFNHQILRSLLPAGMIPTSSSYWHDTLSQSVTVRNWPPLLRLVRWHATRVRYICNHEDNSLRNTLTQPYNRRFKLTHKLNLIFNFPFFQSLHNKCDFKVFNPHTTRLMYTQCGVEGGKPHCQT